MPKGGNEFSANAYVPSSFQFDRWSRTAAQRGERGSAHLVLSSDDLHRKNNILDHLALELGQGEAERPARRGRR